MKMQHSIQQPLTTLVAVLALVASISLGLAQNTSPTNTFDTAASTTSFVNNWWGIGPTITWDSSLDAGNDPFSGSVRYEAAFTEAGSEQFMTHYTIANRWGWDNGYVLDATTYTNLSFDIKVDPASYPIQSGANYGGLRIGLTTKTSWDNRIDPPTVTIPLTATNWTHFNLPIDPTWQYLNEVVGFYIYIWSGDAHTNMLIFNLDNIMLTQPSEPVVIPPPTVSIKKSKTKLNLVASTDVQYERRNIRTTNAVSSWVGSAEPMTYELTIKDAPGVEAPYFQAHIFLVPSTHNDTAPSVDWNAPNLVWFHIENLPDGGGQVTFRYTTNLPNANNMLFNTDPLATNSSGTLIGVGSLGTLTNTAILGTWKLTMANNTEATLTTPDGSSMNISMPADAAALFAGELWVYFGIQANNATQYGKGYVFDNVKISTPSNVLIEDDFTTPLDLTKWEKRSGDPNNSIFVVTSDTPYWLKWTLPAVGFTPQATASLAPDVIWTVLAGQQYRILSEQGLLLNTGELDPQANYFNMIKRGFSKLQILLPGETAAPGTPTGKTGTPDPQFQYMPFDIIVNAVDDDWYPISDPSTTDLIHLTSTDEWASLPADTAMANGTVTLIGVTFASAGTHTITASDLTDETKTADTSSPITVNSP